MAIFVYITLLNVIMAVKQESERRHFKFVTLLDTDKPELKFAKFSPKVFVA